MVDWELPEFSTLLASLQGKAWSDTIKSCIATVESGSFHIFECDPMLRIEVALEDSGAWNLEGLEKADLLFLVGHKNTRIRALGIQ